MNFLPQKAVSKELDIMTCWTKSTFAASNSESDLILSDIEFCEERGTSDDEVKSRSDRDWA